MTPRFIQSADATPRRPRRLVPVFMVVLLMGSGGVLLGRFVAADTGGGAATPSMNLPQIAGAPTVPAGMVHVPGGETRIGSEDGEADERPVFRARLEPFFMDEHPVTVAQFRAFVEATGYLTEAEGFGNAGVFSADAGRWMMVTGANWRFPAGPEAAPAPDDHPVTQVSWNDAAAYARWAGNRLPSEIEWEHAARGGRDRPDRYPWGDHLVEDGRHYANTWNGRFPEADSGSDGYPATTSPVGSYGQTELGLTDMGGNVWEWTADWYRPYDERGRPLTAGVRERSQRGGSYLCSPDVCHGFRVSARSHSTPETALGNVGFRTVRDVPR